MNQSMWKHTYEDGVNRDFEVIDVRQYYDDKDATKPKLEMWIKTPYRMNDDHALVKNVLGYAVVDLKQTQSELHNNEDRRVPTVELYQGKDLALRNLEDIAAEQKRPLDIMVRGVSFEQARKEIAQFASASSHLPHVMKYDEYMTSAKATAKRFQIEEPGEQQYVQYLHEVEQQLLSRDVTYIGGITKMSDMSQAYITAPSFGEEPVDYDIAQQESAASNDFC